MRSFTLVFAAALPFFAGCSLGSSIPPEYATVARESRSIQEPANAPSLAEDEVLVAKEARLDAITRIALEKSPVVVEARARTDAALARVKASGRLPDLELKYELWGQPLHRPLAFGQTQMHMFGLRQTFPAAGSLDARTRMAMEDAKVALELQRARELDVVADVRKAWSTYWAADREASIHGEHAELTTRLLELSKVQLQVGKSSQGDVLRLDLELTRIHADVVALEQQKVTSRARLNTLMGRALDAPLGAPPEPRIADVSPRIDELRAVVTKKRPELAAATASVEKGKAAVAAAKSEANNPTVMIGVDYQLMPTMDMPHNFGAMVQLGLPWLNARHGDEVKAAEASLEADKAAAKALETAILLQLQETIARFEAARATFRLLDHELLPKAQKTFESMQTAYGAGGGASLGVVDALRTYLQVRIERSRALAQVEIAIADVERAIGTRIPGAEVKP